MIAGGGLGPYGLGPCGPTWALMSPYGLGPCGPPLGSYGPGPCEPPWALMGRALVYALAFIGRALVGPCWALMSWAFLGPPGRGDIPMEEEVIPHKARTRALPLHIISIYVYIFF